MDDNENRVVSGALEKAIREHQLATDKLRVYDSAGEDAINAVNDESFNFKSADFAVSDLQSKAYFLVRRRTFMDICLALYVVAEAICPETIDERTKSYMENLLSETEGNFPEIVRFVALGLYAKAKGANK